jgi:7-keto-8-aminopelargonate synthetase-like enzyme
VIAAIAAVGFRAVVTNGVHPFTGRIADLGSICDLARRYDAIVVVDDALGTSSRP